MRISRCIHENKSTCPWIVGNRVCLIRTGLSGPCPRDLCQEVHVAPVPVPAALYVDAHVTVSSLSHCPREAHPRPRLRVPSRGQRGSMSESTAARYFGASTEPKGHSARADLVLNERHQKLFHDRLKSGRELLLERRLFYDVALSPAIRI